MVVSVTMGKVKELHHNMPGQPSPYPLLGTIQLLVMSQHIHLHPSVDHSPNLPSPTTIIINKYRTHGKHVAIKAVL